MVREERYYLTRDDVRVLANLAHNRANEYLEKGWDNRMLKQLEDKLETQLRNYARGRLPVQDRLPQFGRL